MPWAESDGFRLDGVVVLVDATNFRERLADERTRPLLLRQLEPADLVIVSKSELVTDGERDAVRAAVADQAPDVPVVDDLDGSLGSTLLDLGTRRERDATATPPPSLLDPHRTEIVPLPAPSRAPHCTPSSTTCPTTPFEPRASRKGPMVRGC